MNAVWLNTRYGYPSLEGHKEYANTLAQMAKVLRAEGISVDLQLSNKPITSIPLETRMGKGKGEPEYWAAVVRPGTVMYEVAGVPEETAKLCFNRLAHKMPVKCRLIRRKSI